MNELVSIITASYNSSSFIREMIESVQRQTYQKWELLITDDGSTDNTQIIISNLASQDSRIRLFVLDENSGAAVARNNSIKNAKGNCLAFLDSDDTWEPEKLEKQVEFLGRNPQCPLVYSAYNLIDSTSSFKKRQNVPLKLTYEDLLKSCSIGCLTVMVNIKITGRIAMPLLKKRQDFALWLKILRKHKYALGITESLANYRVGKHSISSNKFKVVKYQWQTYYNVEKLGILKSSYYMIHWALRGFFKHYVD